MKITIYGHRFGHLVVKEDILESVRASVEAVTFPINSMHKARIKEDILLGLHRSGWSDVVNLSPGSGITITSVKDQVGLCFQSGNMARMYADMIKLQALYERETIYAGIMLLFTHPAAKLLGSNLADFDRLVKEFPIFERVISAPIAVVGIES